MAFRILSISDDVEPLEIDGLHWHPLRHTLDVRGFGLNAYSAANAGDELIEEHTGGRRGLDRGPPGALRGAARRRPLHRRRGGARRAGGQPRLPAGSDHAPPCDGGRARLARARGRRAGGQGLRRIGLGGPLPRARRVDEGPPRGGARDPAPGRGGARARRRDVLRPRLHGGDERASTTPRSSIWGRRSRSVRPRASGRRTTRSSTRSATGRTSPPDSRAGACRRHGPAGGARSLIGQQRRGEARVLAEQDGARDRAGPEALAHAVQRGVERPAARRPRTRARAGSRRGPRARTA